MRTRLTPAAIALTAAVLAGGGLAARAAPGPIAAAVADPSRPADDVAKDASRKPAEVLAFAGVKPGDVVIELLPGHGYFTRILSRAVGPSGQVVAAAPPVRDQDKAARAIAADPAYANVKVAALSAAGMATWPKADIIFTAQNYHDFHLKAVHVDVPATDAALFAALKPGGVLVVEDHAAAAGAPLEVADTLHRIDPAIARRELEAAGFVFDGQSPILQNPQDDHTKVVFDPAIRGHTDQFLMRFKRPA